MKYIFFFWILLTSFLFCKDIEKNWKNNLLTQAKKAREQSYSPYSKYAVGAAVLTTDGKIFKGTNVENASYGLTVCAERSAIFSAVSLGYKNIKAIAIVLKKAGMPCGACRQVLNEFNPNTIVIVGNEDLSTVKEYSLSKLLVSAFGPKNLK